MGTSEEEEAEASELASRTSGGTGGLWGSVDGDSRVKTTYKLRVGVLEGTTFLNEVGGRVGAVQQRALPRVWRVQGWGSASLSAAPSCRPLPTLALR